LDTTVGIKQLPKQVITRFFLAVMLTLSAGSLLAHHSATAAYKSDGLKKIDGVVVSFLFRNPHCFLDVNAPDEKGVMQTWTIEWFAGGLLARQGVTRDTIKPGDHVIAVGHPGRNPADHRMRLLSISRPSDGWKWSGTF
jgi:hypothetical protein